MPWVESHTVLIRHRKVLGLARELRLKPAWLMGHLHALWHAALEQQEDGDLTSWTDEMIAEAAHYTGNAATFVKLLQKYRLLDGKLIHDWLDYAGKYLRSKYMGGKSSPEKRQHFQGIVAKHGRTCAAGSEPDEFPPRLPPGSPTVPPGGMQGAPPPPDLTEQNHSPLPPEDLEEKAGWLAREFFDFQRGRKEDVYAIGDTISEMLRVGYPLDFIRAEVHQPKRDRSERFWKLKDRLEKVRGVQKTATVEASMENARKTAQMIQRKGSLDAE